MTLIKAIEDFDAYRSNCVSIEQKIQWISELDKKINAEFLENRGGGSFEGYTKTTPYDTRLKALSEFSEIYSYYMNMKLDYFNGEITRFNNSATLFNRLYKEMGDAINRKTKVSENVKIKVGDFNA